MMDDLGDVLLADAKGLEKAKAWREEQLKDTEIENALAVLFAIISFPLLFAAYHFYINGSDGSIIGATVFGAIYLPIIAHALWFRYRGLHITFKPVVVFEHGILFTEIFHTTLISYFHGEHVKILFQDVARVEVRGERHDYYGTIMFHCRSKRNRPMRFSKHTKEEKKYARQLPNIFISRRSFRDDMLKIIKDHGIPIEFTEGNVEKPMEEF